MEGQSKKFPAHIFTKYEKFAVSLHPMTYADSRKHVFPTINSAEAGYVNIGESLFSSTELRRLVRHSGWRTTNSMASDAVSKWFPAETGFRPVLTMKISCRDNSSFSGSKCAKFTSPTA